MSPEAGTRRDLHFVELLGMLAKWTVGFFGLSGILYGCGFLALRSQASFLGVWSGATSAPAEVADEGGRFLYHTVFVLASPFASPNRRTVVFFSFVVTFWATRAIIRRLIGSDDASRSRIRHLVAPIPPVLLSGAALLLTARLLNEMWQIAGYHDILRSLTALPPELASTKARYETYESLFLHLLISVGIGWLLCRTLWHRVGIPEKALVAAQLLLVSAGLLALPLIYGRLVLTHSFPSFTSVGTCNDRLLLGQDSNAWIVWDRCRKETEVVPKTKEPLVTIGARESLLN